MAINEFKSIATFIRVVQLGSLRKAAHAQGLTPQAASKALAQLEAHLGVRLFHRTTRSMSLTEEGQRLLETAQPALQSLEIALREARHTKDEIAGALRIVGPRSMVRPVLVPVLEKFCSRYPAVQPDIQLDDQINNWVENRVDVGFRLGVSPHEGVIARRLFPVQLIICAAPSYLNRYGVPENMHALVTHRCSVYRRRATGALVPWRAKIGDTIFEQHVAPAYCSNDEDMELEAVLSGLVIGQLAGPSAAAMIRDGRLIPLFIDQVVDNSSLFLYYGSRSEQPSRARAFIDLTIEQIGSGTQFVLSHEELADRRAAWRP